MKRALSLDEGDAFAVPEKFASEASMLVIGLVCFSESVFFLLFFFYKNATS